MTQFTLLALSTWSATDPLCTPSVIASGIIRKWAKQVQEKITIHTIFIFREVIFLYTFGMTSINQTEITNNSFYKHRIKATTTLINKLKMCVCLSTVA